MPRTRIEKLWLGGAAATAALLAIVGYFFVIGPQQAKTTQARAQVVDAQLQGTTLQTRIVSLTSQQKKLASYRAALSRAEAALPTADDVAANPALLRSFQLAAQQSGVSISSLTVGDPAAVAAATPTTATSGSPTASSSTSSATAPGAAPTASLYSVGLTAGVDGSTRGLVLFLTRLQYRLPRAIFVSGVTVGSSSTGGGRTSGGSETMTLTMSAFVRPSAASAAPTTSPTTP